MNRNLKLLLIVAPLLAAYPVAAWVVGGQVESAIDQQYQLLAENPSLKVVERDYRRGLFGATETVTFELFGDMTRALARQRPAAAADAAPPGNAEQGGQAGPQDAPPPQSLRVSVRSVIRHGPLAGFSKLAAAVVDSELVLDGDQQQRLLAVFGNEKPLRVHTEYRFDGGGASTLSSPAFSTHWPAAQGAGQNTLAWDGVQIAVDFEKGMKRYTLKADAPRLDLRDSEGGGLRMTDMRLTGEQQRVFDDDALLYAGTQQLTVAELGIRSGKEGDVPILLRQLRYAAEMPVNGEFLDVVARLGTESLLVGGKDFGPAHYDVSLRHLHARTAATLYRTLVKTYADPALSEAAATDPAKLLAPLARPAAALLQHDPVLSIDRLSFRSPHGEALLKARVGLKGMQADDLANPLMLLAKLDASAEVALPEALIGELGKAGPAADETAGDRGEMLRQRLAGFVDQGLVVRDGPMLRTRLAFAGGRMHVNGKPFNPLAVAPGKPGPAPMALPPGAPAGRNVPNVQNAPPGRIVSEASGMPMSPLM